MMSKVIETKSALQEAAVRHDVLLPNMQFVLREEAIAVVEEDRVNN